MTDNCLWYCFLFDRINRLTIIANLYLSSFTLIQSTTSSWYKLYSFFLCSQLEVRWSTSLGSPRINLLYLRWEFHGDPMYPVSNISHKNLSSHFLINYNFSREKVFSMGRNRLLLCFFCIWSEFIRCLDVFKEAMYRALGQISQILKQLPTQFYKKKWWCL